MESESLRARQSELNFLGIQQSLKLGHGNSRLVFTNKLSQVVSATIGIYAAWNKKNPALPRKLDNQYRRGGVGCHYFAESHQLR